MIEDNLIDEVIAVAEEALEELHVANTISIQSYGMETLLKNIRE